MMRTLIALGTSLISLIGGSAVVVSAANTSVLVVDDRSTTVSGFAKTVGGVLTDNQITITERDRVTPDISSPISSNTKITVSYHRLLTLVIDGEKQELETYDPTLALALNTAKLPNYAEARVSHPLTEPLPVGASTINITTPKPVTLTVGGKVISAITTAGDVATFLREIGHSPATGEDSFPNGNTPISKDLRIAKGRIEISAETKIEPVSIPVTDEPDTSLFLGETKTVSEGQAGEVERTYTTVKLDSVEFSTQITAENVTVPPSAKKIVHGTRIAGTSGKGIDLRREAMWERVAACESSHNWQLQDRQYYGGLQFHTRTWVANGGRDFAPRADLATREQQITVANRLYDKSGISPWACKG